MRVPNASRSRNQFPLRSNRALELGRFSGYSFVFGLEIGGINMARVFPLDFRCERIKWT
jgi:hypothetical protein